MPAGSPSDHILNQSLKHIRQYHMAQFYENEQALCDSVSLYCSRGLKEREAVFVIATAEHLAAFEQSLSNKGLNVARAKTEGQLITLDAHHTLEQFMIDGVLDAVRFRNLVGPILENAGNKFGGVRAYGEMVNILWTAGQHEATFELERLWDELARTYSFTLLCGYHMAGFAEYSDRPAFNEVCHCHTHVIPVEDYRKPLDTEAERRLVAVLQQQARALQTEIRKHQKIVEELRQAVKERDQLLHEARIGQPLGQSL